jgi:hypothetical protein
MSTENLSHWIGAPVLGLGLVWAGYSLWSSKVTSVLQPAT